MKKILFPIIFSILASGVLAQNAQQQNNDLINTWYQWPHEGANGEVVYKTTKYLPVPGIDRQDEPFRMLTIKADGNIVVGEYCGYCPAVQLKESTNTYLVVNKDGKPGFIQINPGNKNSKATYITIVLAEKDKLVLK